MYPGSGYSLYGQNMRVNTADKNQYQYNNTNIRPRPNVQYPNNPNNNYPRPNNPNNLYQNRNNQRPNAFYQNNNNNNQRPMMQPPNKLYNSVINHSNNVLNQNKKYADLEVRAFFRDDNSNTLSAKDSKIQNDLNSLTNQYLNIFDNINKLNNYKPKGVNADFPKLNEIKKELEQVDSFNGNEYSNFIGQLYEVSKDDKVLNLGYDTYKKNPRNGDEEIKKIISDFKYDIVLYTNKDNTKANYKKLNNYINKKNNDKKKQDNNNNYNNNNNNNYNNNNDINYNDNENNSNNNNDLNPAVTMRSSTLFELEDSINGLIGLANIGATCYMNATLQCFSNIELLRTEFLDPSIYDNLDKNKETKTILSFALAEVFRNLWIKFDETKKYYAPENFKKIISEKNPLFQGIQANDPKDLILFMFETMHSELKTTDLNVVYDSNWVPNEHILEEVYKDFSNYYLSKNKSIIFDIFYGCTNIVTSCINCKSQLHNVQVSNILFFPLEEVRKYKKYNAETPVTIIDCFEYNQRCDVYESYYCNGCNNNNSTAISFTRFLYTPRVLVINLNRGKGIQFNVKINFDEFIDIKNFVVAKESPYKYELIGVICHFGESGMGGHFIAFCKHFTYQGSKWYKFNDAFVEECTFNDVKTSGMPYVLFYSFLNVDES